MLEPGSFDIRFDFQYFDLDRCSLLFGGSLVSSNEMRRDRALTMVHGHDTLEFAQRSMAKMLVL